MITLFNYIVWLLSQPAVQEGILILLLMLPLVYKKYKARKERKIFDKIVAVAIDVCQELLESKLSNTNKKINAMNNVYKLLPSKVKNKVKKEVLENAVETAYQEYVKIKKK